MLLSHQFCRSNYGLTRVSVSKLLTDLYLNGLISNRVRKHLSVMYLAALTGARSLSRMMPPARQSIVATTLAAGSPFTSKSNSIGWPLGKMDRSTATMVMGAIT